MDQYTAAELSELYLLAQGLIDTQFQYWMTITFAVVVAAFAAGERLSRRLRYIALVLYWLATITLFLRLVSTANDSRQLVALLSDSEALVFNINWIVVSFRLLTFLLGTFAASAFLLSSNPARSRSELTRNT